MTETHTLIVGASLSGLASAASLQREGMGYTIIEQQSQVASPWRNHYERLHLHTNKSSSNLPFKKFGSSIPRYPSRQHVVDYVEDYRAAFSIEPLFNTTAQKIKREGRHWITVTNNGVFRSINVIIATGPFGRPQKIHFKGMESFPGRILHSYGYTTGREYKGQDVLVVGGGNSACEIAIDLYEQGARPSMAVRSPVNVVPRDILGIPILQLSIVMSLLPPRIADAINAPLIRLMIGNIKRLGFRKLPYGPLQQIRKYGTAPVLDIGTIRHIRKGHIEVYDEIDRIEGSRVYFESGREANFDTIIAAIGYYRDYADLLEVEKTRFYDLRAPVRRQKYFGKDGLYFCGFWIAPTGQIREIASDAKKIAKHIARQSSRGAAPA
ncbi:MAG TPA: NAD(P)/FAD-dependent oxidoreductase [Puia sp.]|nr:NAD(P)/FAD-dependent oxidoreductase [Puia sp.]